MADTTMQLEDLAARPAGDGMPIGNTTTPLIQDSQVEVPSDEASEVAFDDDAAATIAWADYMAARAYLDNTEWLAEWQYIDYLYQSPTFDRDWRSNQDRAAVISRFNVAKNRNTMSNQVRRGIFADTVPFLLEPRGKLGARPDAQLYLQAWTQLLSVLSDRADLEYNLTLLIECLCLQGTGIANMGWETKPVIRKTRVRKGQPVEQNLPDGSVKKINTWDSDKFKVREETVEESWPFFEYRRLGTTLFDEKWNTPNRPDLSCGYKIDVDYVTFDDLREMRELTCYKDIPEDDELKRYFLQNPLGDAPEASDTAEALNGDTSSVMHATGENQQTSKNPFDRPFMKIARWTKERVIELLCYDSRRKVIRNEKHNLDTFALGAAANWWNIDSCGYGIGIGRLNAGDQRMDQGVLNEVLKMIAYPMSAPVLYDRGSGNAPTQDYVFGLGTMWGIDAPGGDVRKAMAFMQPPTIPTEAWKIYELGKEGGEDLVGANSTTMQGNLGPRGSSAMRTAAGVNRVGSKADENVSDPIAHIEGVMTRWLMFLWEMVLEEMPIKEIREILSDKMGDTIVSTIDPEILLNAQFNIKILAGQKLVAKAAIAQLIPFLLQLIQQPQLLQFLHEKGQTINFGAIEQMFMQVTELAGREDIFIPLTDEEKQMVQQMNPNAMKAQLVALQEQLKGKNKLQEIDAKSKADLQRTVAEKAMDHVEGSVPLELAEARTARNSDMDLLQNGVVS